ncbi:alpha-glucoside transport system permease protein [Klenkia soli]|uniref:Alpha-glucoside transport system permease protein n=1 Tax=Klenkia soli TaxID=1052260 RepID=A0A1H0MW99_9ACTN|nr:carbohydrate ABC transporter permease [Klenkia soli]SDO84664.1 alpha-glucoside transport system permease protein [Klenkia soli]
MSAGTGLITPVVVGDEVVSEKGTSWISRKGRKHDGSQPTSLWVKIVLAVICLGWFIPVLGLLITSVRAQDDATNSGWWTVFTSPSSLTRLTLENFGQAFTQADLGEAFANSLAISIPATIIPILVAAFAAYAFSFMQFWGRDVLLVLIVALLVIPNQVALVPLLKLYGDLGINGTFLAVWLAHIGFGMPLAVYLIRNYMSTLPKEVIESAKIDGASHFQTFWRLIIPMSTPALASFAIFQFLWVWNDLLVALVFIGPGANQPLTIALNGLLGQQGQGWQLLTAGGLITMLVPIAVFLSLQRYFVRGLTAGSVKG